MHPPLTTPSGRYTNQDYREQADFRVAVRRFVHHSEEQARAARITPQQHLLLLITRGHHSYPGVSIGEIATALQIRPHGASLLVDRCVRRGLLHRIGDPKDRRRALITLTPDGQEILDRITEANRRELGALDEMLFRESLRQALLTRKTVQADEE